MTTTQEAAQPDIRTEVRMAFGVVLAAPGRILRFAGLPFLLSVAVFAGLMLAVPPPSGDALVKSPEAMNLWIADNAGYLVVGSLLSLWGYGRFLVRWYRWTLLGEDATGFLDPGLGRRELRTVGWTIVVGMIALPTLVLLVILSGALALVGDFAFGIAGAQQVGGYLGGMLGSLLGFYVLCYVMARLSPGVVPVALDGPVALGASWRASGPIAGPAAMILWLLALPMNLLGSLSGLAPPPFDTVLDLVGLPVTFIVYAASSVFTARLSQAVLGGDQT